MIHATEPLVKGFKYRIYPSKDQKVYLNKTFGCCRFVYNHLLAVSKFEYEQWKLNSLYPRPRVNSFDFINKCSALKKELGYIWLNEVSSCALQQKAQDLGKAFSNFFKQHTKGIGYPKFKKRYHADSFRLTSRYFKITNGVFSIIKCYTPIKIIFDRDLPSAPSQVTISRNASGQYFASFLCEYTPEPITTGIGVLGIDVGIKDLVVTSKGDTIENPKHYLHAAHRLARLQRRLSKTQKGSKNRTKARLKVARLHQHIANQRCDHLHKLSTQLIRENQAIVIEDLNVKGMSQNRKLAKHVITAGWSMFRKMLEYKAQASQHVKIIIASRWYPSTQLCSACYQRPSQKLKLSDRGWTCEHCGTVHQRDVNAAQNLKLLGEWTLAKSGVLDSECAVVLADQYPGL